MTRVRWVIERPRVFAHFHIVTCTHTLILVHLTSWKVLTETLFPKSFCYPSSWSLFQYTPFLSLYNHLYLSFFFFLVTHSIALWVRCKCDLKLKARRSEGTESQLITLTGEVIFFLYGWYLKRERKCVKAAVYFGSLCRCFRTSLSILYVDTFIVTLLPSAIYYHGSHRSQPTQIRTYH